MRFICAFKAYILRMQLQISVRSPDLSFSRCLRQHFPWYRLSPFLPICSYTYWLAYLLVKLGWFPLDLHSELHQRTYTSLYCIIQTVSWQSSYFLTAFRVVMVGEPQYAMFGLSQLALTGSSHETFRDPPKHQPCRTATATSRLSRLYTSELACRSVN